MTLLFSFVIGRFKTLIHREEQHFFSRLLFNDRYVMQRPLFTEACPMRASSLITNYEVLCI